MASKDNVDKLLRLRKALEKQRFDKNLQEYSYMLTMCDAPTSSMLVRVLTCGNEDMSLSTDIIVSGPDADTMAKMNAVSNKVGDILKIWRYAGDYDEEVLSKMLSMRMDLIDTQFSTKSKKRFARTAYAIAHSSGIAEMIDSYYAGVPLEDILA